jgi:DNA-binding Xre family transcriptional regulator
MKKITAYQIAPEYQTSPLEYSDAPENVYIFGNDRMNGIRADEIDEIRNALENIADAYNEMQRGKYADGNANLHACIWYHMPRPSGIVYTRAERLQIVKLAQEYNDEPYTTTTAALRAVCDALEILHGIAFDWHEIRGCCQGDWQYIICPDEYGREYRREIETEYFNTGDEWNVNVDGCECAVYTHSYRDDEKRQEISAAVGCDPSDVILYAFDGYERIPKYKEVG